MCAQTSKPATLHGSFDHIVGKGPFHSMADFQSKLKHYERVTGTCYYIRSTYSIERRAKVTGFTIPKAMGYYWVRYLCVHNGRPLQPNVRKRRVQDFSCPSDICLVYDEELKGLRITRKNLKHNHPTAPSCPEAYPKNRRLTNEQEEVMFTLLDSFHSIGQLKHYAETLFQIRLTSDNIRRLCDRHKKRKLSEGDWETTEFNSQPAPPPQDTITVDAAAPSSESMSNGINARPEDPPTQEFGKEYFVTQLTTRLYEALVKLDGQNFEKCYARVESVLQQCLACALPAEPPPPPPPPPVKKRKPPTRRPSAPPPPSPQVLKPVENTSRFRPILPKVLRSASTVTIPILPPKP